MKIGYKSDCSWTRVYWSENDRPALSSSILSKSIHLFTSQNTLPLPPYRFCKWCCSKQRVCVVVVSRIKFKDKDMARRFPHGTGRTVVVCSAPPAQQDSDINEDIVPLQMRDLLNGSEVPRWISEAEWIIGIDENTEFDRLRLPSDVSIFIVPNFLIESTKRKVYVPTMVTLGPYHHHPYPPMNSHKERALHRMMTRFIHVRNGANESTRRDFSFLARQQISQLEDEIRNMYEEKTNCPSDSLTLLLIQDGCFILEILRTLGGEIFPVADASNIYEPIFERYKIDFTGLEILNDMLKLENQIPLNVLRSLLRLELNSSDVEEKLSTVLVKYPFPKFYPFKVDDMTLLPLPLPQGDKQIHHLLSWLHSLIVHGPELSADDISGNDVRRIPRAVELKNAGIKFKPCEGFIKRIHFDQKEATIFLPHIYITDHTEVLFRNLIALEVCKASEINYVTCYLSLMDELIDTAEDVALLREKDIVTNCLGSDEEAAQLFNGLLKGVTTSRKDTFKQLKRDVNKYYKSKFNVWFAELMKEHFSSPWGAVALVGSFLLLLFTVVQTVFSIIK